jgi:hypothetical protein
MRCRRARGRSVLGQTMPAAGVPARSNSVELLLPALRNPAGRSGHGLVQRVMVRRREDRTLEILLGGVIPEPLLIGLERLDDRMAFGAGMAAGVLRWGRVAAADMAAMRASAEMEPPATGREAFDAAGTARRDGGIDVERVRHWIILLRITVRIGMRRL